MSQPISEAARLMLSAEDVAAFSSTWQTLLRNVRRRFFCLDPTQIEDAIHDVIVRRLTRASQEDEETGGGHMRGIMVY